MLPALILAACVPVGASTPACPLRTTGSAAPTPVSEPQGEALLQVWLLDPVSGQQIDAEQVFLLREGQDQWLPLERGLAEEPFRVWTDPGDVKLAAWGRGRRPATDSVSIAPGPNDVVLELERSDPVEVEIALARNGLPALAPANFWTGATVRDDDGHVGFLTLRLIEPGGGGFSDASAVVYEVDGPGRYTFELPPLPGHNPIEAVVDATREGGRTVIELVKG
jgi:hypothetical protein